MTKSATLHYEVSGSQGDNYAKHHKKTAGCTAAAI